MSQPRARPDVILRPMGAEWILYDPETRDLHVLNVSAALVWSHLDGVRTLEQVAEAVAEEVSDAPDLDRVRRDVLDAVETFRESGLLTGAS
jgi:hypothetical protein